MTNRTAIQEKSARTAALLEKGGFAAHGYRRNPTGPDSMLAMSNGGGRQVSLWAGLADLETRTNRRYRQGVLTASEDARTVVEYHLSPSAIPGVNLTVPNATTNYDMLETYDFNVKGGDTTTALDRIVRRAKKEHDIQAKIWRKWHLPTQPHTHLVKVTQTAEATTTSFLVGMDETAHFVAQLPQVAATVDEAHDILRPKAVKGDWKRQGEWFFVPAPRMAKKLNEQLDIWSSRAMTFRSFESGSSHVGLHLNYNKHMYAIGPVVDTRKGHHKTIILPTWHRVIRNNEVENRSEAMWD